MLNQYHLSRENGKIRIAEESYDPAFEMKTESLFAQVNGRIGIRACFGLPSLFGKRETFCAGFFGRAFPEEVAELVNCPDVTAFHLRIAGRELSPDGPLLRAFRRVFCPETGELIIHAGFSLPGGEVLEVKEQRFAGFADPDLFVQKITVQAVKGSIPEAELVLPVNGQASNEGVSHFTSVSCRVFGRSGICLEGKLPGQMLRLLCLNRTEEGETEPAVFTLRRRGIEEIRKFRLAEGSSLSLLRLSRFQVNPGAESFTAEDQAGFLRETAEKGYDRLLGEHVKVMEELLRKSDVRITGASEEEQAVLALSRYHLLGMMHWNREDCGIASKGLTGEGYRGHVFWDTELFIQPFFTWFFPEQSRHMLGYRLRSLPGAEEKAKAYGCRGAMYPWESAADGREETPLFAALNIHTGKAAPVWSGRKEHHVGADIAYALWQYLSFSGDRSFLREGGYEMLFKIADFWVSRAERDPSGNWLVIRDIIGPDEYTEHIDNNAYTNYMAAFAVRLAANCVELAEKEVPGLCRRLNLKERESAWVSFIKDIYLPQPDAEGIIPQDDTFLQKAEVPEIDRYRDAPLRQMILRDYTREQVNERQVLKQADTVMLLNLFPGLFPPETVRKNVLFYEARTIHDSSLSYCAHAQACAAAGLADLARKYFQKSLAIDWNDNPLESTDGIHAASMGGIWNCVVQGFAGISCSDGVLSIDPHLPDHWSSVELPLEFRGCRLRLKITRREVEVTVEEGTLRRQQIRAGGRTALLENHLRLPLGGS